MSPLTRAYLEDVGKVALFLVPVAVAWGVLTASVAGKVDRQEYIEDITELRSDLRAVNRTLHDIQATGDSTAARVRDMYCAGRGKECR